VAVSIRGSSIRRSSARVARSTPSGDCPPAVERRSAKSGGAQVFPLHLDTVGGTEYSAIIPSISRRNLRAKLGNQFVSLFGNGTCGDINHVDRDQPGEQSGHEESSLIGTALADTVHRALPRFRRSKDRSWPPEAPP